MGNLKIKNEHIYAILLLAVIGFATGWIIYDETGLHFGNQPIGGNGFFDNNGDGDTGPPSGDPYVPDNPVMTLEVNPITVQRGDMVTLTVTSNMRNVPIMGSLSYVDGTDTWIDSEDTVYLDANGRFTQSLPSDNAGVWHIKVNCPSAGIESNTEIHTCLGITIYQDRDQWHVGETYTGWLTGTYRNWWVLFFFRNQSDVAWEYADGAYANAWGQIPYGTLGAGPIVVEQVGMVKEVMGIVVESDPEGYAYIEDLMEQYQSHIIPAFELDSLEAQGHIVKSNILTVHLVD